MDMIVHERICIAAITGVLLDRGTPAKILDKGTGYIIQDLKVYIHISKCKWDMAAIMKK